MIKTIETSVNVTDLRPEAKGTKAQTLGLVLTFIETVASDRVNQDLRSLLVTGYNAYCKVCLETGEAPLKSTEWLIMRAEQLKNLAGAALSVDRGHTMSGPEMDRIFGRDRCDGMTMSCVGLAKHNWLEAKTFKNTVKDYMKNRQTNHTNRSAREIAKFVCQEAKTAIPESVEIDETELVAV